MAAPVEHLISIIQSVFFFLIWLLVSNSSAFFSPAFIPFFPTIVISINFLKGQDISFTLTAFEEILKANSSSSETALLYLTAFIFFIHVYFISLEREKVGTESVL